MRTLSTLVEIGDSNRARQGQEFTHGSVEQRSRAPQNYMYVIQPHLLQLIFTSINTCTKSARPSRELNSYHTIPISLPPCPSDLHSDLLAAINAVKQTPGILANIFRHRQNRVYIPVSAPSPHHSMTGHLLQFIAHSRYVSNGHFPPETMVLYVSNTPGNVSSYSVASSSGVGTVPAISSVWGSATARTAELKMAVRKKVENCMMID